MASRRLKAKRTKQQKYNQQYEKYRLALSLFKIEVKKLKRPTAKSIEKVKKQWQKLRKDLKAEEAEVQAGLWIPTLNEAVREAKGIPQTHKSISPTIINTDEQVIQDYLSRAEQVYLDTIEWVDNNKSGSDEDSKLASIAEYKLDAISRAYHQLLDYIKDAVNTYGSTVVADAITGSTEIDYNIAITLIPPSDIQIEFEQTLENFKAMFNSAIEQRIEELEQTGGI